MFVNFSEETKHLLKQAEKERDELKHPYVGSEHLLLAILKEEKLINILKKYNITYQNFKNKLISMVGIGSKKSDFILYTPMLKRIIEGAVLEAKESGLSTVNPENLIIAILNEEDGIAFSILMSMNINLDKLYFELKSKKKFRKKSKKLLVEELGTDLIKLAKNKKLDPVIGRADEIKKTIEVLHRRKKNNPILIGPAGVGKTAIVEGIANIMVSPNCPKSLFNKRIIALNIFSLVSGTKYRGEFEEKMKNIIRELEENEDIILFIDEIHTIIGAGGAEGAIDASNILKPALARGLIKVIGATTLDEYKKFIEPDAALARRFQNITVEEPSLDSVIKILKEIKSLYEKYHNIIIPNNLINDIVCLSSKYLKNRFEPDRSIDILDEVCAMVSMRESKEEKNKKVIEEKIEKLKNKKIEALKNKDFNSAILLKQDEISYINKINNIKNIKKVATKKDVLTVVKNKGNIKIYEINDNRKLFYNELKNKLNKEIIGEEENIEKLIKVLLKKELLKTNKCFSLLVEGKKRSGKKHFINSFLSNYINEKNIINIDLSEYKEHHMISKLLGTTAGYLGYDNKNNVFEKVRSNPSSAIIIDNFDDGCIEVQNLFIRILQNSKIEDASGKLIDFSNAVLIFIKESINDNVLGFEKKSYNKEEKNKLESMVSLKIFINKPSRNNLKQIFLNKVNKIKDKYSNIKIIYDEEKLLNGLCDYHDKSNKDIEYIVEEQIESKVIDALIEFNKSIKINIDYTNDVLV